MMTSESISRDIARILVWYPVRWIVSFLPISAALTIFRLLGHVHYLLSRGKRNTLMANFEKFSAQTEYHFPAAETTKHYFETHYINQLLTFLFPKFTLESISRIHSFDGLERLEKELSSKRGCILIHGHFGPVHLPLFHLGITGYDVKQLGYLRKPKGLSWLGENVSYRLRQEYEKMIPAEIIQVDRFLGKAFDHLKNNGILMITGDGTGRGEFIGKFEPFSFLGQQMLFPIGPARLAKKTGSSIIPIFTISDKGRNRYVTIVGDPILSGSSGDSCEEKEITNRFVRMFESYLVKHPSNWHLWDEFSDGNLTV